MFKKRKIIETEEFKTFSEEIDYLSTFFCNLSDLILLNGHILLFISDKKIYKLDSALIDSSAQTLRSIKLCCSIGSFSDANTLIRKLRDDLMQYVYIIEVFHLRETFSVKSLKNNSPEEFTEDELAVCAWIDDSVSDLKDSIKRKLEFKNYMTVLKKNKNVIHILTEYKLQGYWETLRKKLNDYVHSNGSTFSKRNNVLATDKNLEIHLKNISIRTSYVSSVFIIVLLMINSSLISATDYIDCLECNIEPPEDSQYLVANFVQDFINKKVSILHPELKQYLIDNNIHGMKIE